MHEQHQHSRCATSCLGFATDATWCWDHHRRSLIGVGLDTHVCQDDGVSSASVLLPGILLLLHLCSPAQYGIHTAAAACAALAALLADGSSTHPQFSAAEVGHVADCVIQAHSLVVVAAMQHNGLAAELAQQRPDAIIRLAAAAYEEDSGVTGDRGQRVRQNNAEVFGAFKASSVQVRVKTQLCWSRRVRQWVGDGQLIAEHSSPVVAHAAAAAAGAD
jgi:hypothetical protein